MKAGHGIALIGAVLIIASGCGKKNKGDEDGATDAVDEDAFVEIADDGDDAPADVDEEEAVEPGPGDTFDRFCEGEEWDAHLTPATIDELGGEYSGYYPDQPLGTVYVMKIIPEHPFHARTIRVAFAGGMGTARIRLMKTWGRSYPDLYAEEPGDLVAPVDLTVSSAGTDYWYEADISDQEVYLEPTQHYAIVYQQVEDTMPVAPMPAVEELTEGDYSHALMIVPTSTTPYGVDGNFRMQVAGDYFCAWEDTAFWFDEDVTQPFADVNSSRATVSDINGDGHDDLILNDGGPVAFLGDGDGNFAAPGFDPFPDAPYADTLIFGDMDNDGDVDAFTLTNISPDADGDGTTKAEGDCDDGNVDINPFETEVADNGLDDDCDGTADDGTDTSDGDGDGVTIAAGDCDDTRDTTYPGAEELQDNRDNDCDGETDEDLVNSVMLNDGSGLFALVPSAGVEALDPSAAGAMGDGNADGYLDIYWGNWLRHYPDPLSVSDVYVTGVGDGTFTDVTASAGMDHSPARACYGVLWTDYNNDGHQDVWVGNYGYGLNFLWDNQGDGTFTEVGDTLGLAQDDIGWQGGNTFGGDFGDFDNDGDMDNYAANIAHPRYQPSSDISTFNVNQGPPDYTFVNMREEYGFIYDEGDVNATFADYDNDMDLDIVIASLYTGHFSRLYRNDGVDGFTDVTYETHTAVNDSVSAVWIDVDEDGDLDLVIADRRGAEKVHLFINQVGQDQAWVQLVLEGTSTNRDAIGARVTLTAGGVTQIREVKGGGGHSNTQSTHVVHFGLGSETAIDSVTVSWVGGSTETITGLAPGGRYHVVEGSGTGTLIP